MSDAYKCDVCGELAEGRPESFVKHRYSDQPQGSEIVQFELCDSCDGDFWKFSRNEPHRLAGAEPRTQPSDE